MAEWEPLNMELRSWVISRLLRVEQTSSSLIKSILRMFNEESKTLGNQSSALSFRTKIDLLRDLEEIDKKEYNHLIKLMEIRNQFAHNANATSFEKLDSINPNLNKYLLDHKPKDIKTEIQENLLRASFENLFKETISKLLVLEIEYNSGIKKEIIKHLNHEVVKNLDTIWSDSIKLHKESKVSVPIHLFLKRNIVDIDNFYMDLKITISSFVQNELKKISDTDAMKQIFKNKESTEEFLSKIENDNIKEFPNSEDKSKTL